MRMDRINDKANKFIKDVQKKKTNIGKNIFLSNKDQVKLDVHTSTNACLFCPKIFFSSSFLLKHVFRRHSGDLILCLKKCQQQDSINNSSDLSKQLEQGFSMLRNEIIMLKQPIDPKDIGSNVLEVTQLEKQPENTEEKAKTHENVDEIDSSEFRDLKNKVNDMEVNIQSLHNKFEELNNVLRNEVLKKQDIEDILSVRNEKIFRIQESKFVELRQVLLKELQTLFSGQLHEQKGEWKLQMTELRHDIKKLDWIIDDIKKQLYSPDYINVLKEKLEHEIFYFLDSSKRKSRREKNLRTESKITETKHVSPKENKMAQGDIVSRERSLVKRTVTPSKYKSFSSSPTELAYLLDEKLSDLNIKPSTSKISSAEFGDKLRLINSKKECLNMKYSNFSEVYNDINTEVNQRVHLKLDKKKRKKTRFSDPVVLNEYDLHDSIASDLDYQNKTFPVTRRSSRVTSMKSNSFSSNKREEFTPHILKTIPSSEEFDVKGSGDRKNFQKSQNCEIEEALKTEISVSSVTELKSSSPIKVTQVAEKAEIHAEASTSSKIFSKLDRGDSKTISRRNDKDSENSTDNCIKKFDEPENSVTDDFEESSLQSLSSWEEDKLHSDH